MANYLSSEFKIRFQLESDGGVRKDGWYVDDIGILIYTIPTSLQDEAEPVTQFELEQNYPNPFNPSTKIKFTIPSSVILSEAENLSIQLKVYDVLGNEVATLVNEQKPAGNYEIEFNSSGLIHQTISSGIYFYQLRAGSFIDTKKMILLK